MKYFFQKKKQQNDYLLNMTGDNFLGFGSFACVCTFFPNKLKWASVWCKTMQTIKIAWIANQSKDLILIKVPQKTIINAPFPIDAEWKINWPVHLRNSKRYVCDSFDVKAIVWLLCYFFFSSLFMYDSFVLQNTIKNKIFFKWITNN